MIIKNESLNFIFYYLTAFTFTKTVFFFLISFFKSEISENCVLREVAQTLKNFTFIINHEKLIFKTFFIVFIKLFSLYKLRNIFFLNAFLSFITFNFFH